jgi:hypothetical protein
MAMITREKVKLNEQIFKSAASLFDIIFTEEIA